MPRTGEKALSKEDRRLILLLAVPSGALQLCLAILSTYVPVLARQFTASTITIGALVGAEGLIAVLSAGLDRKALRPHAHPLRPPPPVLVRDRPRSPPPRSGWRRSLRRSRSLQSCEMFFFYVAYFAYFAPYQALYPDPSSLPKSAARAQGVQGVFLNAGLGVALVGGGLLLDAWRPLPYLFAWGPRSSLRRRFWRLGYAGASSTSKRCAARDGACPAAMRGRRTWRRSGTLLRDRPAILYFVAGNAFLTLGLGGLKSFVVLWLTEGLGKSMTFTAGAMGVVAVGAVAGALVSGKLADRYGPTPVIATALLLFGIGLGLGTFSTSIVVLGAAFPLIAIAGGAAFALPYALLMRLMPSKSHGTMAGLFDVSSGVGTLLGPTVAGAAIGLMHPLFTSTRGYGAMCGPSSECPCSPHEHRFAMRARVRSESARRRRRRGSARTVRRSIGWGCGATGSTRRLRLRPRSRAFAGAPEAHRAARLALTVPAPASTAADTAFPIAAIRALEAERPPGERLFDDPFAALFAPAGAQAAEGTARFLALPFFVDGVRLRTRFIDDVVRASLRAGLTQVVLLGSGFDTRPWRMSELADVRTVTSYEIDFPAQLERKRAILEAARVPFPPAVVQVPCDFTEDDFESALAPALAARGFRLGAGALFVWEGVIGYLDAPGGWTGASDSWRRAAALRAPSSSTSRRWRSSPTPRASERGARGSLATRRSPSTRSGVATWLESRTRAR